MQDSKLRLTVNVVTCGRFELFKKCMHSVEMALPDNSEILVFANGADEQTLAWLEANQNPALRWCRSGRMNLSRSRNKALALAKGRVLYCLDDDVEVPSFLFEEALARFDQENIAILGGPNLTPSDSTWRAQLFGAAMTSWFVAPRVRKRYGALARGDGAAEEFDLMFCNLAISLERIPGWLRFREVLRSNQENTFVNEVLSLGLKVQYSPKLFVYHYRRANLFQFLAQIQSYGYGRSQQMLLGWNRAQAIFLAPAVALLLGVYWVAAERWWCLGVALAVHLMLSVLSTIIAPAEIKRLGVRRLFLPPLTCLIHLAYGYGFWKGLFRSVLSRQKARDMQPPIIDTSESLELS